MRELLLALVVGYVVGSASPAALLARARGVDLRASGSGNPGATNVGRLLGRKAGVLVAVLDVAKGAAPSAVFGAVVSHEAGLVAGAAAVAGHVTSPWLRGRGGKGAATAGGAILGSHPAWAIAVIGIWVVVAVASRWVALASICAALALPIVAALSGRVVGDVVWALAIATVVVVRHRGNITRWLAARRGGPAHDTTGPGPSTDEGAAG